MVTGCDGDVGFLKLTHMPNALRIRPGGHGGGDRDPGFRQAPDALRVLAQSISALRELYGACSIMLGLLQENDRRFRRCWRRLLTCTGGATDLAGWARLRPHWCRYHARAGCVSRFAFRARRRR
jgi:hypothetical protein